MEAKLKDAYLLKGQMLNRDVAINGQCQYRAELWDQKTGYGARIGPVQVYDVHMEQGRFRIQLNEHVEFGPSAFRNQGHWLDLGIKCSGDSDFVRFEDRRWVGATAATFDLSWWMVAGGRGLLLGPPKGIPAARTLLFIEPRRRCRLRTWQSCQHFLHADQTIADRDVVSALQ